MESSLNILSCTFNKFLIIAFVCLFPMVKLFYTIFVLNYDLAKVILYILSFILALSVSLAFLKGGKILKYIFIIYLFILSILNLFVGSLIFYNSKMQGIIILIFGIYLGLSSFYVIKKY